MPRELGGEQLGDESPDPDGRDIACHLLSRMDPPPRVDASTEQDPQALAELLCDHAQAFDGSKLVHALAMLLFPLSDRLTVEQLTRECYLLSTRAVSEDAIARLYDDLIAGRRVRPIAEWLRLVVARSIVACATDPAAAIHQAKSGSTDRQWTLHKLCLIVNGLPYESRRIAWLMFVAKKNYKEIAAEVEAPMERVEMFISQLAAQAYQANVADPRSSRDAVRRNGGDREDCERSES